MNKILVPTDFSEQADNALKVAAMLAKTHDAEIYLLHMMEIPMQQLDPINAQSDVPEVLFFMKLAHKKFEDLIASDYLEGVTVHETVKADITFNEIIGDEFAVNYIYSTDGGVSFSDPITLFMGTTYTDFPLPGSVQGTSGESQSMIFGNDNMFHLTFVDWSDSTKAKHLIFEPFNFSSSILLTNQYFTWKIWIDLILTASEVFENNLWMV